MKNELSLLVAVFAITSVHSQTTTPNAVQTRIGTVKFEKGFPTEETTKKLFDEWTTSAIFT